MKIKTLIIITALLLFVIFIASRTILTPRPRAPQTSKSWILVPPAPTTGITQPTNVSFSFVSQPVLPSSLSLYFYTDYSVEDIDPLLSGLLSVYGILPSPSSLLRAGVITKTWEGNGAEVSIHSGTTASLSFRHIKAASRPPAPLNSQGVATQFISNLIPIPQNTSLTFSGISTDVSEGLLILDNLGSVSYEGVLFTYTLGGYPIIPYPYTSESSFVVVDNLGIVRASTIHLPPQRVYPIGQTKLLSQTDILINLSNGLGTIISISGAGPSDLSGAAVFTSFSIDKTTLVYARRNELLVPALILHGYGTRSSGARQEAEYFLWGSPDQTTTPSPSISL